MIKKAILILSVLLTYFSPVKCENERFFTIANFSGGLNSAYSPLTIADNEVQDAQDVWFDEDNSIVKRNGYSIYSTTTQVNFSNGWSYTDASNNNWILVLSSDAIRASKGDGVFSVVVATVPTPTQSLVGAVNAQGRIYFVDNIQGVYYWNGSGGVTYVANSPKGSLICEYKGRVWVAGEAQPNQNRLSASKYLDGTVWTTGSLATDPITYTVGLNDTADGISALFSGLNDAIYIFKKGSIYALYGFDQTDFQVRVLTSESGCIDSNTVQSYAGGLVYLSKRGFELFNGVTPILISKKINNKLEASLLSSFSQRSWTLDSQTNFAPGSSTPSTWVSTTIVSGSVVLDTATAVSPFVDTLQVDFGSGTLTSVSTTAVDGSVTLQFNTTPESTWVSFNTEDVGNGTCASPYFAGSQSFTPSVSFTLSKITLKLFVYGSPGDYSLRLMTDSSNEPSVILDSTTITSSALTGFGGTPGIPGSSADYEFTMPGNVVVSAGTRYWVQLFPLGTCIAATHAVGVRYQNSGSYPQYHGVAGGPKDQTSRQYMLIKGSSLSYSSNGSIVSRTFDVGFATDTWLWDWGTVTANSSLTSGTTINYETQTSSDGANWNSLTSVISGSSATSTVQRYIRYKASLGTTDSTNTPQLNDVTISMSPRKRPFGTYISPTFNIGSGITSFGSFDTTSNLSGGAIEYTVCTSSMSTIIPSTCATQSANSQITAPINSWVQFRATFTITTQSQNPVLQSSTLKWNEGTRRPNMTSKVFENRYWVSLTTNSLSNQNDCTFVLSRGVNEDSLIWTKFNIQAGAYILYKDLLYHADANATGRIFLDNSGTNDAGSSINSYIITKDYAPEGVISDKIFKSFWLVADALGSYNIDTYYFVDRTSTQYQLSSVTTNEQNGFITMKLPFPYDSDHQVFGRTISFMFRNYDIDSPMRLYGGNLYYFPRKVQ